VRGSASCIAQNREIGNHRFHLPASLCVPDRSGKPMNTEEMRLVRRVTGRRGSLSLYRFRHGFAEVLKVSEGDTDVIEVRQHELNVLGPLLNYMDEVQGEINALSETADEPKQRADAHSSSSY